MSLFLFFDTETTGLVDFRAPLSQAPRLVQLGAILCTDDGREMASMNLIVSPREFQVPDEAAAVHGISTELARSVGVPLLHVLLVFGSLAKAARHYVCHNADYDLTVMEAEFQRLCVDFPRRDAICTMKSMTEVCQIPGRKGFKWPNLTEAHLHAFGKPFDSAHDAMADVRACRDVFFWMKKQIK